MSNKMFDFDIETLGEAKISSPIRMSRNNGDGMADYVSDEDRVLYSVQTHEEDGVRKPLLDDTMEEAGPREKIYFNPSHVHAAICTCGGICPGLNNVIRAVVRCFWYRYGVRRISGIQYGYLGLLENSSWPLIPLDPDVVDDIQEKGGTILGSARGGGKQVEEIVDSLERLNINILITIGGDGTYRGALALSKMGIRTIAIPGTIDNDIAGTKFTIGFDTALNTAVEAVDKLRDTSSSHRRCSIVEVMGRNCGDLAIWTAIAVGAECVICKETGFNLEEIIENVTKAAKSKNHAIIIAAEHMVDINELAREVSERTPFEARTTVLGYIQRGGCPSAKDRVLASEMGVKAVQTLVETDETGVCVCDEGEIIATLPIEKAINGDDTAPVLEKYKVFKMLW